MEFIRGNIGAISAAVATGLSILFIKRMFSSKIKSSGSDSDYSGRKRAMSFSSRLLIDGGGFPAEIGVAAPIINIAFYFDKCPSTDAIIEKCEVHFLKYERFNCTPVVDSNGKWTFESRGKVNFRENHISTTEVDDEDTLLTELDRITATDLDGYGVRPLWSVHRIVNSGVGINMVVFRIHHSISDGIGLQDIFTGLFVDNKTKQPINNTIPASMRQANKVQNSKISLLFNMVKCFFKILALPIGSYDTDISFSSPTKKTMKMSKNLKNVIFPTVRFDFIKNLKNKAGVTVNDILYTATGGAIRRYCEKKGEKSDKQFASEVLSRCLMPVAFPRPAEERSDMTTALRNKFAFMSVPIPLNGTSSKERLVNCNKVTMELKSSPMAFVQYWIQTTLLPLMPKAMGQQTAYDLFSRHSMVFSNIPGIDNIPSFCDENVRGVQIIFPNLLPQVILITFGKQVFYNMVVDLDVVKDPECLKQGFIEELKALADAYGVEHTDEVMLSPMSAGGKFGVVDLK